MEPETALEGDDISYGYNLGFMTEWGSGESKSRIGVSYRSGIEHLLTGTTKTVLPTGTLQSRVQLALPLPGTVYLSGRFPVGGSYNWVVS